MAAQSLSGWRLQRLDGQEDRGIHIQPSHIGLKEGATSDLVCLAVEVGPVRFRYDIPKKQLGDLGAAFLATSADETRKN